MKKFAKITAIVLVILSFAMCFVACQKPQVDTQGEFTLVIATQTPTEISVPLDKIDATKGLMGALEYLKQQNILDYTAQDSQYGAYLTKVGDLQPQSSNEYVALFTSVEKDFDTSQYAITKEYKGKKVTTSGLGASSMSLSKDAIIYICILSY